MDRLDFRGLGARPAFFPAVALLLGAALSPPTASAGGKFLFVSVALLAAALVLSTRPGAHLFTLAGFACLGAGLGGMQRAPTAPLPADAVRLSGTVLSAAARPDGSTLTVDAERLGSVPIAPRRVRLFAYGRGTFAPGERVLAKVRLRPFLAAQNPGERDGAEEATREGLWAHGTVSAEAIVHLSAPSAVAAALARKREQLTLAISRAAPTPDAAAVLMALAAGREDQVSQPLRRDFAASGLAHVLSVSGLHVAALALVLLWALRRLLLRLGQRMRTLDTRALAAPLALPLAWGYVAFTGWQVPAVRSALMASLFFLGLAIWRRSDALNALAWAALALVAIDPAAVADLSFQLSCAAVLGLIVLSAPIRALVPLAPPSPALEGWRGRLARALEACLTTSCASLAATLATAPIIAHSFHRLSLAGLIANAACLPLCGALSVASAFGAGLFALSPPLAAPLLFAGGWLAQLLVAAVHFFAALPLASLPLPSLGVAGALVLWGGLVLFALGRGRLKLAGVLAPLAIAFAWAAPALAASPGLSVTFLSVGHGDAILLASGGHFALVDGGGVPDGPDVGRLEVLPALREAGVRRLDLAVLSHPHPDHALGLASVLQEIPTGALWVPAGAGKGPLIRAVESAAKGAKVVEVERGQPAFTLGEARIEVLGPPKDRTLLEGVNDRSVVLRVTHGAVSFLLTGDLEAAGEEALDVGPVTVLKAPHHGSGTSSTPELIARTRPRFVVFSVARHSRFHFPNPAVVERYRAAGARCWMTARDGAISFFSDGLRVRVESFQAGRMRPRPDGAPGAGCELSALR